MLLRVSCMAILIAVACIQFSSAETKLMDKLKEKTTKTEMTSKTMDKRNKRALYYQNDLISNKERQIRKAFPFGTYGLYDYAYGLPAYDYLAYDYLYNPLLGVSAYGLYDYGLYGGLGVVGDSLPVRSAAAPIIAGTNSQAVETRINPAVQAAVDYNDDYVYPDGLAMLSARRPGAAQVQQAAIPLSHIQSGHYNGYVPQQHFAAAGIPQHFAQQAIAPQSIAPQAILANQQAQAQQYAANQRNALNAIRAASTKGNAMNA